MIVRFACAAFLLLSMPAFAGQIFLLNGDVITGDIKKIWDEEVTIEPAYADEFNVDLDAIAYFESEREFDVEFADGREAAAKLVGGGDGQQVLEVDGVIQEVPVMQLAELDEPEDYFDWETNIDVNSTVNTGNTDNAQGALQFNTNLKVGDHRHIGDVTFARDETDGVTTKEQDRVSYAYNWSFKEPWFVALNLSAERDPIRNLERRISIGGGVGYNFWDDANRFFQVQGVAGYQDQEFTDEESNDNAIGGWILRFRYRLIDDLTIFHDHGGTTNLSGRSNNVFQSSTGVRYEITDLLYFNLQFDFDHESNPAEGVDKTDTTTLLGAGLEF